MSVLKLSEISDKELATRLLTTTGRLEPHCEELARRLLAWCEADFVIDVQTLTLVRQSADEHRYEEMEVPSHRLLWRAGDCVCKENAGDEPEWWEEPAAGEA